MGNQTSYVNEQQNSEEKLLRRNFHKGGFPSPKPSMTTTTPSPYHYANANDSYRNRARSLEPRSTQEIHVIEHSKSARYRKRQNIKRSQQLLNPQQVSWRLWDPEEHRKSVILNQLQNPININNVGVPSLPLKTSDLSQISQSDLNNDISESEQTLRSLTGLSSHQTQILQKIWARASQKDALDCTRNIFLHLLRSNAFMYQFFNLTQMTDKEILNSTIFARQSANFASVFDFVINNIGSQPIDQLENVCFSLQALGERHFRIIPYSIEDSHWSLFTRVFEDNPLKLIFQNATGHKIWKILVAFIVKQMRIGYDHAFEEINSVKAPKKISIGEAFLNASQYRNSSLSFSTTSQQTTYQRSMSAHNSSNTPLTPKLLRNQIKRSFDISKSTAKSFSNAN